MLRRFDIEYQDSCDYDHLEIRKGSVVLESLCGIRPGEVFRVFGPEVTLNFQTDMNTQEEGFAINYRIITVDEGMLIMLHIFNNFSCILILFTTT